MHVIWDWNGTLFDDFHFIVEASNASSLAVGGPEITAEAFRQHHVRPLSLFYERLIERRLTEDEWQAINRSFHDRYEELHNSAELAIDAVASLDRVADSGATQSLLSMWVHDSLVPVVQRLGIDRYFVRIDGVLQASGDTKVEYMLRHIERVAEQIGGPLDGNNAVVIGDSADDGEAAKQAGVSCVLVPTGVQAREALEATGWPVSDSLLHAVEIAGL